MSKSPKHTETPRVRSEKRCFAQNFAGPVQKPAPNQHPRPYIGAASNLRAHPTDLRQNAGFVNFSAGDLDGFNPIAFRYASILPSLAEWWMLCAIGIFGTDLAERRGRSKRKSIKNTRVAPFFVHSSRTPSPISTLDPSLESSLSPLQNLIRH